MYRFLKSIRTGTYLNHKENSHYNKTDIILSFSERKNSRNIISFRSIYCEASSVFVFNSY